MSEREAPLEGRDFYDQLERMVLDILDEHRPAPRLASVDGRDGGNVRVTFDNEAPGSRQEGFRAAKGVRYDAGDRVIVERMGTKTEGEDVIAGPLGSGGAVGKDELIPGTVEKRHMTANSVTGEELAGQAIERRHLKANVVSGTELDTGAVETKHLRNNVVGNSQLASGAVDRVNIRANAVTGTELASGAVDSNHIKSSAVDTGQLANGSVTSQKLSNSYASENHSHNYASSSVERDVSDLVRDVRDLKSAITVLDRRLSRVEKRI